MITMVTRPEISAFRKSPSIIKECVRRPQDLCARYGGEEFIVLLPNTSRESALQLAEKIRKSVELENIPHAYSRASSHVTISIGVVSMIPQAGLNQNILVEMADKALYNAKKSEEIRSKYLPPWKILPDNIKNRSFNKPLMS